MKRIIITLGAAAMLAVTAAAPAAAVSENASPKACFGQDRAAGVQALGGREWGDIASDRKGSNSDLNREYREACRAEAGE